MAAPPAAPEKEENIEIVVSSSLVALPHHSFQYSELDFHVQKAIHSVFRTTLKESKVLGEEQLQRHLSQVLKEHAEKVSSPVLLYQITDHLPRLVVHRGLGVRGRARLRRPHPPLPGRPTCRSPLPLCLNFKIKSTSRPQLIFSRANQLPLDCPLFFPISRPFPRVFPQ